jgi:hypothetical protein
LRGEFLGGIKNGCIVLLIKCIIALINEKVVGIKFILLEEKISNSVMYHEGIKEHEGSAPLTSCPLMPSWYKK